MWTCSGNLQLAAKYKSASQKARVVSEAWVAENAYCLRCESDRLIATPRNTQARDFECVKCGHGYELKSASSAFGKKVVDGAYASMMRRVQSATVPSFFLLQYSSEWRVMNLHAIHHALITPASIEQRSPLALTARRAGWVGCNIVLSNIPPEGRISMVVQGNVVAKEEARRSFAKTERLITETIRTRSWAAALLLMIHRMGRTQFSLQEIYKFELELAFLFPSNRHIRAKIRQQLQVLRDSGWLEFSSRGRYTLTNNN